MSIFRYQNIKNNNSIMRISHFNPRGLFPSIFLTTLLSLVLSAANAQQKPSDYYGFEPGSDGNLFTYEELIKYLQEVDAVSARMQMTEIGNSPEGRPMYIAFFSSEENIAALDDLRQINRKLALDPDLPEQELKEMMQEFEAGQRRRGQQMGK